MNRLRLPLFLWLAFSQLYPLCLPVATSAQTVPQTAGEITLSFAPVVKRASPAVVNIYTKQRQRRQASPFADDPFFRDFFGGFQNRQRAQNTLGSGVVLSPDGLIVTNHHVVANAVDIRVVLADRREFEAQVVLADQSADLAILRVQQVDQPLEHLTLATADSAEVGDLVLAIGNPFGVGQTVSSGIISGLARSPRRGRGQSYYLQTDAAINPGNSGGALIDMKGRLMGVPTAILTRSGGSNGVGFAIPADLVAAFLRQAQTGADTVVWPWIGLRGQPIDGALAEAMDLATPDGLVISEIHAQSPFAKAGLLQGDVIAHVNGAPVQSLSEIEYRLMTSQADTVRVDYIRHSEPKSVDVRREVPSPEDTPALEISESALAGLRVSALSKAQVDRLNLPLTASGVVVTAVSGPAQRFGFRPGDVLVRINGQEIRTPKDVADAAAKGGRRWSIDFRRGGQLNRLRYRL